MIFYIFELYLNMPSQFWFQCDFVICFCLCLLLTLLSFYSLAVYFPFLFCNLCFILPHSSCLFMSSSVFGCPNSFCLINLPFLLYLSLCVCLSQFFMDIRLPLSQPSNFFASLLTNAFVRGLALVLVHLDFVYLLGLITKFDPCLLLSPINCQCLYLGPALLVVFLAHNL